MKLIVLLLLSINLFAQNKKLDTVFCDCNKARVVNIIGKTIINKTIAPNGAGQINEISPIKQNTKYSFEKEHYSAWYKINIQSFGNLTFDIKPNKLDDDYDFMLFKASTNNFCDSLSEHKINPIRACISRNTKKINGKTGLSLDAKVELVKKGIGNAYVSSVKVKKGECYYLVLDNVYDKGEGHLIEFNISVPANISGFITDENQKPIEAEVTLTNYKGDTVVIKKTDKQGSYNFIAPLVRNQNYSLNYYNDSSSIYTKSFTIADTSALKNLKTILNKLKKGNKYNIGSINFVPGSLDYLSQSIPTMNNLYKLMKKNNNLKIKIIGHSNGRSGHISEELIMKFTIGRANSIKNYLIIKGIDKKRIMIDGKGDHEMIYKLPQATEEQQIENRRVEIMVLDY